MKLVWLPRDKWSRENHALGIGFWHASDEEGRKIYLYLTAWGLVFFWPAPDGETTT